MKKEKEICASFAVAPQTAKVEVTVHDKCLVNTKKDIKFERETTFTKLSLQYIVIIVLFCYYCC